jgi:hypothetical protein
MHKPLKNKEKNWVRWPLRLAAFAVVLMMAGTRFALPSAAQSATRPPISGVQMEKLLRVIDQRGENVRLNDRIASTLGLGVDVIIRQATATDPVSRIAYFFATIPSTGQYLVGTRDLTGADMFLIDSDLRLIAGVATHGDVQKIPLPEAGKKSGDILERFAAFLEMN